MNDTTNLIYNSDFSYGQDGWIATYPVSDGVLSINSSAQDGINSQPIPVMSGCYYQISMDIMITKTYSGYLYITIPCYTRNGQFIGVNTTEHSSAQTTLSQQLKNGDTVVYVQSTANFYSSQTYRYVGICDSPALKYSRVLYEQKYDSSSLTGTSVTLQAAWAGGTWNVGTPVGSFTDGGTYIYPWVSQYASLPMNEWVHISGTFNPSASRPQAEIMRVGMLSYSGNLKVKNIVLTNITQLQTRYPILLERENPQVCKTCVVNSSLCSEGMVKARYIRDWIQGSSANTGNHWVELEAFDEYGSFCNFATDNVTFGDNNERGWIYPAGNSANTNYKIGHLLSDGSHVTSPYAEHTANILTYAKFDLGRIYNISKIIHWHYLDGRTYHKTKVDVSADGINWITLFDSAIQGEYAETQAGHVIEVKNSICSIGKSGINANEFIEI